MDRSQGSNQMLWPYPGPSFLILQCYVYYVYYYVSNVVFGVSNVMYLVLCCCYIC